MLPGEGSTESFFDSFHVILQFTCHRDVAFDPTRVLLSCGNIHVHDLLGCGVAGVTVFNEQPDK